MILSLTGCAGSLARGKFAAKHPDCEDATTLHDADGTVHVIGCAHVEKYDCTTSGHTAGTRVVTTYEEVSVPSVVRPGTSIPLGTAERTSETPVVVMTTGCVEHDPDRPVERTQYAPRAPEAPPVQVHREGGRVSLRLELVNRDALLRLTASPSEEPATLAISLGRRELDHRKDACALTFAVNDQPFPAPKALVRRADALVYQTVVFHGEPLSSFDRIKRLTLTVCEDNWRLSRDQILRVRELMARFRREVALARPVSEQAEPEVPSAAPAPP